MPVVTLNSALVAIRGRVGDVVFKTYRDKVVMTRRRDRLKAATAFAQRVYVNAVVKAFYGDEARRLGRQPFRLAISDHLRCGDRSAATGTSTESARFAAACRMLSRLQVSAENRVRCRRRSAARRAAGKEVSCRGADHGGRVVPRPPSDAAQSGDADVGRPNCRAVRPFQARRPPSPSEQRRVPSCARWRVLESGRPLHPHRERDQAIRAEHAAEAFVRASRFDRV